MVKHKTKLEWIKLFKLYEVNKLDWVKYFASIGKGINEGGDSLLTQFLINQKKNAKVRFRKKYKLWKNNPRCFMNCKIETRGRKPKYNIDDIISQLTDKEKDDIIRRYLEIQEKKKKSEKKSEASSFD